MFNQKGLAKVPNRINSLQEGIRKHINIGNYHITFSAGKINNIDRLDFVKRNEKYFT